MKNKNYVLHSTKQSRENNIFSLLACFETCSFVIVFWLIFYYFDFYSYMLYPILIAPFLLLQTPNSISLSHKLFFSNIEKDREKRLTSPWSLLSSIIGLIVAYSVSSLMTEAYQLGSNKLYDFLYGYLIVSIALITSYMVTTTIISIAAVGISSQMTMSLIALGIGVGIGKQAGIVFGLLAFIYASFMSDSLLRTLAFSIGYALGALIRSIVVKIIATSCTFLMHPILTICEIPKNYRKQIFVNDSWYTAELLPNIANKNPHFSLLGIIMKCKYEDLPTKLSYSFIIPFWTISYLYRWSIKSTAWFYLPLAFLTDTTKVNNSQNRKTAIDMQADNKRWYFHISLLPLLFGAKLYNLLENSFPQLKVVFSMFKEIQINYPIIGSLIHPYSVTFVFVATVIYFITFWFSHDQIKRRQHGNPEFSKSFNKIIFLFIRLRLVLWYLAFICSIDSILKSV